MTAYDIEQSYDWNYAHAPKCEPDVTVPPLEGTWDFCGFKVDSPLGMPAGPLLNSDWIGYYGKLGFSVLTYKTVRSVYRACYGLPNLLPVVSPQLTGPGKAIAEAAGVNPTESWAISFGMPSKDPTTWRADVERARQSLRSDQVLVVSVVASPEDNWTLEQIAADFTRCAVWAVESGAHAIEANLSCPNVCSKEGQLYTSPAASNVVSSQIRSAIGRTPLVLKIGLMDSREHAHAFVEAVRESANALSTVNSVSASVVDRTGAPAFGGLARGIGGKCIRDRSNTEVKLLRELIRETGSDLRIIGVGGLSDADDVKERIEAGADHVQLATAAMLDPMVGVRIRGAWA